MTTLDANYRALDHLATSSLASSKKVGALASEEFGGAPSVDFGPFDAGSLVSAISALNSGANAGLTRAATKLRDLEDAVHQVRGNLKASEHSTTEAVPA
jgi:hypothetical protein